MKFKLLVLVVFVNTFLKLEATEPDTVWMRQTQDVLGISFHPSSQFFAVGGNGAYVGIWDVNTATQIKKYQGYSGGNVFFSKTGKYLVQSSNTGFRVYNFLTDSIILSKDNYPEFSSIKVAMSSDEKYFAVANILGLTIWDLQTGKIIKEIDSVIKDDKRIQPLIWQLEFSPDGIHLAFSVAHGDTLRQEKLRFLNLSDFTIDYECPIGWHTKLKYSNDGTKIAFTSPDPGEAIKIIDVKTKQKLASIPGYESGVGKMVFSSDDKYLIFSYGQIIVWDLINNKMLKNYPGGFHYLSSSNDNKYIAGNIGNYLCLLNFLKNDGVQENSPIKANNIFPNPSDKNILNLTFELTKSGITTINIFNINGQLTQAIENKFLFQGNHNYSINISNLVNGSYHLEINSGSYKFSQPFIINR